MNRRTLLTASAAAFAMLGTSGIAAAQTTLRIFTGGQQRPDVMRQILDEYQKRNPEREGRGRGRRRDLGAAAAIS